jgi:hypothetical protein
MGIKRVSNEYQTSIKRVSNEYQTSIERVSNEYRTSIERVSNEHQTGIKQVSNEHQTRIVSKKFSIKLETRTWTSSQIGRGSHVSSTVAKKIIHWIRGSFSRSLVEKCPLKWVNHGHGIRGCSRGRRFTKAEKQT